jgi:hypothetical protein
MTKLTAELIRSAKRRFPMFPFPSTFCRFVAILLLVGVPLAGGSPLTVGAT